MYISLQVLVGVSLPAISWGGCLRAISAGWLFACKLCWVGVKGNFSRGGGGVSLRWMAMGNLLMRGATSSSQRKKRASTDARLESAQSAKVERGRVKRQHRHNTLVYNASSRNRDNVNPLETAPPARSAAGSDASNDLMRASAVGDLRASTPPPPAVAPAEDVVASNPARSSDARHGGLPSIIVISTTSEDGEDGGAETPTDLQEVSLPDTDEDFDEDGESLNPKKNAKKTMI